MSLPIAAAGRLSVVTNPILALSCAAAGAAASASTVAKAAFRCAMSSSLDGRASHGPGWLMLAPELLGREVGALAQRLELLPDHGVVHLGAIERLRREAAIGGGDDVLATHELRVAHDALGDQLGMLHDVAGVGDHAGADHFAFGNLDALEQVILVLVARIGRLEAVGAGVDLEHVMD